MATETGPDLSAGRVAVEALMDDTVTVVRPGAETAEVLDLDSLALIVEAGTPVYEGPGLIGAADALDRAPATIGGDQATQAAYKLSIPLGALELMPGDLVTCTSSRRDDQLVGKTFRVDRAVYKTMAVSRKVLMTLRA